MARSVQMPQLGESVTEGTISRWLKQVGDRVEVDEPLVEITTDKVDTEIPSPVAGVIERIIVAEDETADVGAELVIIGDGVVEPAAAVSDAAPPAAEAHAPEAPAGTSDPAAGSSSVDIVMPVLGESVTEGTVTRWLVSVGDVVATDQPILEVSTDKVDTEIPSAVAGTVLEIVAGEDAVVPVGGVLARIGTAAAQAPASPGPAASPEPAASVAPVAIPAPATPAAAAPAPTAPAAAAAASAPAALAPAAPASVAHEPAPTHTRTEPASTAYVTPIVRKLATDLGVDLAQVSGSGVGGRIRRQDVVAAGEALKAAATASAAAPVAPTPAAPVAASPAAQGAATGADTSSKRGTTEAMNRTRKVIASRMVESLRTSAQLTTVVEVDVTRIARLRAAAKADFEVREGVKLSFLPFFALAAVEALKAHPIVNASTDGESITYHPTENLGIAVDTERGLMVPVIKDAGDLNLAGLARRISDLAERTRSRKVGPDDLSGSTFTLTNTGSRGALFDTPIINQPEVAILGTGSVVKRPVVVTDSDRAEGIAVRSMVYLALSYDHRIVDGADAARFLVTVKSRLEAGAFDADLGR